jgi:hypothetical protein
MVTQAFPLWGKRDLQHEAALAELNAARGREQATRDASTNATRSLSRNITWQAARLP